MEKNLKISVLLDYYGEMLTQKQREAVKFYYDDDLSLGEIAENLNISRQGVRDNIKRAEAMLIHYEDKLGLACKFKDLNSGLENILISANKILLAGDRYQNSEDICMEARKITAIAEKLYD